jgi:hypothetical protein
MIVPEKYKSYVILYTKSLFPFITAILLSLTIFYSCKKNDPEPEIPDNPITVNHPPNSTVSVNPLEGEVPLEARIRITGSDIDGVDDIKDYILEVDDLGINIQDSKPIDTTLTIENPGQYLVEGFVKDKEGEVGTATATLNVKEKSTPQYITISGAIESNETHEGISATVIPYEVIGSDTLRLYSKTADEEGRNYTNADGSFEFELNKEKGELEEILLMAREGTPGNCEGWVRVKDVPKEDFENVLVRTVPYAPYADRKDKFKRFVLETTPHTIPSPYLGTRFDFDGSILGGLPEFEDYTGLEKIRILDYDPYTGGVFTLEEQEVFKQKLLDNENISGIIGDYEIKEDQIVFGNDSTSGDYNWLEQEGSGFAKASNGVIVIVPRRNLSYAGLSNYAGSGPIITGGVIYLKARNSDGSPGYNEATFSHEMGHLFISSGHPESLYGESIMTKSVNFSVLKPGPADKKLSKINYEKSYLIKPEGSLYHRPDYIKNILRDDFK